MSSIVSSIVRSIVRSVVSGGGAALGEEPAEFIIDGDFPTPNVAWSLGAGWTIADGIAENSGGIGALTETMEASITSGNDYVLQGEVLSNDLFETIQVTIGAQVVYQAAPSPGTINVPFTATVSSATIAIRGLDENGAWAIDNVSLVPAEVLGSELIDATVDFSNDTGWTYGARFTGFAGTVDYDENNPDTDPLTASFTAPLSAGDHRVTFELTATNGEYLTAMADATMIGAHNVASMYSTIYTAAGGEATIVLTPTSELDPSTGTITSVSVKKIL